MRRSLGWGSVCAVALVWTLALVPAASGEIVVFTAQLLGSEETPPITNAEQDAFGFAVVTLDVTRDAGGTITGATGRFDFGLSRFPGGATVNAAHVHQGPPGVAGPIVLDSGISSPQAVTNDGVTTRTALIVPPSLATSMIANPAGFYFNVHTVANSGGAVRGQLQRTSAFEGVALGVFTDAVTYQAGDPIQLKAFVGNFLGAAATDIFGGFGLPADQSAALCGAAGNLPLFFVGAAGATGLECLLTVGDPASPPPFLARNLTIPPLPLQVFTLFSGVVPAGTQPGDFFGFLGAAAPGTFPAGALKVETHDFAIAP